ncbi:MAG: hypothetical protein LBE37_01930 [Sphingobacterium sp.]|jgi:hypothetical protein|uniref:Cbb3-type cytochrome oxidase component FixQ n=4 Tax=Sphingobacterium TaxID=28453 RepID=U2HS05_9SPHI|nr:hypothetical protein [Sphingobacterium]ERJ58287.1 hypothetical protein M472_05870 [Sphingobacterium paucimobilis HER1398]MBL1411351.1 hypothetical protein [Sphingobacterium faecale]MDR2281933.1 hypothetical protein [Sphingobacterium sp.]TDQ82786.1 hypothetical protein CLV99_0007 [Sphingobacterium yanglingense]
MFKQITNLNGDEMYLITSLWIFIVFFALVGIMLFFMKKDYIQYMKDIPFDESDKETKCSSEDNLKL